MLRKLVSGVNFVSLYEKKKLELLEREKSRNAENEDTKKYFSSIDFLELFQHGQEKKQPITKVHC